MRAVLALLMLLVLAAPASAQLRALSPEGAPVLAGDRVLWGSVSGGALQVLSAPVAGGDAAPFGSVPLGGSDGARLAAGAGVVAVVVRDQDDMSAPGRLYVAGADGSFRQIAADVGEEPIEFRSVPLVQVTARGVLTLEGTPFLRDLTGAAREVVLPPGADPELVATAGELGVATSEGVLVVFDLRSGTEIRQVGLERFEDETLNGLALSPSGDVAATVPAGDGSDALLFSPAWDDRVHVLATGREFEGVATGGGRVALLSGKASGDGVRVSVLSAADGGVVFRGPWVEAAGGLGFDGRNVAFWTPGCALAGPVDGVGSQGTLPPGPCVRSEVGVDTLGTVQPDRYRIRVACINAPQESCRVRAELRTRSGTVVGRLSGRARRGGSRVLAIPLAARGRREAADRLRLTVRVTDPDGRSRVVYDL